MAVRDPNARLKYSKQEPAFNGGLIDNDWIGAGLFVRQTEAQKLLIGKDFRSLTGDTTTICMVTGGSEPLTYKLINNPATETTQESDWQLLPTGGGSALQPVGEFDAVTGFVVPTATALQDTNAVGNNGEFYVVTNAPTGLTKTFSGLFRDLEVTVFTGDYVLSVGDYFAVIQPASTWDTIGVPQSVLDYVSGTVIAHTHAIANITGLSAALAAKYDVNNIANDLANYSANDDADIINKIFLDTYYYRKYSAGLDKSLSTYSAAEIEGLVGSLGAGSGLTNTGGNLGLGGAITAPVVLTHDIPSAGTVGWNYKISETVGDNRNNWLIMTSNSTELNWYDNSKNTFFRMQNGLVDLYSEDYAVVGGGYTQIQLGYNYMSFFVSLNDYTDDFMVLLGDSGFSYDLLSGGTYDGSADDGWLAHKGFNDLAYWKTSGNTSLSGDITVQHDGVSVFSFISSGSFEAGFSMDGDLNGGYYTAYGAGGNSILTLDNNYASLAFTAAGGGVPRSRVNVNQDSIDIFSTNISSEITSFIVNGAGSINVSSSYASFGGIQYASASYRANFDEFSLIDKGFADATYQPKATGTPDGTKFLKDDGSWAVPPSGGGGWATSGTTTLTGATQIAFNPTNKLNFTADHTAISSEAEMFMIENLYHPAFPPGTNAWSKVNMRANGLFEMQFGNSGIDIAAVAMSVGPTAPFTFSLKPIQYGSELSSQYTIRSLIDKGYADGAYWRTDADTLNVGGGTVGTGYWHVETQDVTGNRHFAIGVSDTENPAYNYGKGAHLRLKVNLGADLYVDNGFGGGQLERRGIYIMDDQAGTNGILIYDDIDLVGLFYDKEMTSGASAKGNRWIPDRGYNDTRYIQGTLGITDNAVPRANGTGGMILQNSNLFIDDTANLTLGDSSLAGFTRTLTIDTSETSGSFVINTKGLGGFEYHADSVVQAAFNAYGNLQLRRSTGIESGANYLTIKMDSITDDVMFINGANSQRLLVRLNASAVSLRPNNSNSSMSIYGNGTGSLLLGSAAGKTRIWDGVFLSTTEKQEIKTVEVTLSATQIRALNATPIELVAPPSAGQHIHIMAATATLINSTNFTNGNALRLKIGTSNVFQTGSNFINAATSWTETFDNTASGKDVPHATSLRVDSSTVATDGGVSQIKVFVQYAIIDTN